MGERPARIPNNLGGEIRKVTFEYRAFSSIEQLPPDERELLVAAREAMRSSHAPYSRFHVGAAVRLANGLIIPGSNQENIAYGSTVCAEVNTLTSAGAQNKGDQIRKIAIIGTGDEHPTTEPVAPCGNCRQVMKEYEDRSGHPWVILLSGNTGEILRFDSLEPLLFMGFGPKDLGLSK